MADMQSDRQQNRAVEEEEWDGAGLGVEQKEGDQLGKTETKENLSKPNQTPERLTLSQTQTASDTSVTCSTVRGGAPSSGGSPWEDVSDTGTRADPDPKLAKGFSQQPCVQHWGS